MYSFNVPQIVQPICKFIFLYYTLYRFPSIFLQYLFLQPQYTFTPSLIDMYYYKHNYLFIYIGPSKYQPSAHFHLHIMMLIGFTQMKMGNGKFLIGEDAISQKICFIIVIKESSRLYLKTCSLQWIMIIWSYIIKLVIIKLGENHQLCLDKSKYNKGNGLIIMDKHGFNMKKQYKINWKI
ncbi:unnamed protein product [Paramecium primaurelia]|uniref:Uncharacterized protein n=1 Tax=Paramecium primaurelia TaxID=5886 RepID=A0A8S1JTL9_PARPR|nr:unnamed protein product [Paramecium primaurelia]